MRQLVYDFPTRVFHGLFAGLFLTAFIIGKTVDDDSTWFSYHMLAGMLLSFLVFWRIIWGFVGTKYARFSAFALSPASLLEYFKGILSGSKRRWVGHNPASSWAAIMMMIMALGLGITGYLMTSGGNKEVLEDIHELLANGFMITAFLHLAGIALHTIRHQEMIGFSMINGHKEQVPAGQGVASAQTGLGLLLIVMTLSFAVFLFKNYDQQGQTLQLFGTSLQLGESEAGGGADDQADDDEDDD